MGHGWCLKTQTLCGGQVRVLRRVSDLHRTLRILLWLIISFLMCRNWLPQRIFGPSGKRFDCRPSRGEWHQMEREGTRWASGICTGHREFDTSLTLYIQPWVQRSAAERGAGTSRQAQWQQPMALTTGVRLIQRLFIWMKTHSTMLHFCFKTDTKRHERSLRAI